MNKIATHNSATGERSKNLLHALFTTFAKCQDKTIHEQYYYGVRWFDLRVDSDLVLCHGLWKSNKTLGDIIKEMATFEETVYVTITIEHRYDDSTNTWLTALIRGHYFPENVRLVYIAKKKPSWTIIVKYFDVPVVAAYLSVPTPKQYLTLALKDWIRYIPIPRILKKITPKAEFNENCFTMVDFI